MGVLIQRRILYIQYMHVMYASICLCMNTLRTVVYYTLAISIYVYIHVYACILLPIYNSYCSRILKLFFFHVPIGGRSTICSKGREYGRR